MTFQICYTFSDDQLDELRSMYDVDSTSELKDLVKQVGKQSVLMKPIANQVLEELEEELQ